MSNTVASNEKQELYTIREHMGSFPVLVFFFVFVLFCFSRSCVLCVPNVASFSFLDCPFTFLQPLFILDIRNAVVWL